MFGAIRRKSFIFALVLLTELRCISGQDFNYEGPLGPSHWGEQYNLCDGKYQSPINIDRKLVHHVNMEPLVFSGFKTFPASAKVKNNGHTAMVTMNLKEKATISGGPLVGEYDFVQFHFHWGDNDAYGSESLIDYKSFPVELHMVFYKTKYTNFNNALSFPDGIAVVAALFEVSPDPNPVFEELTVLLNDIVVADTEAIFLNPPKLLDLLPKDLVHYYTYNGSLTTPPCSESVTWIDFATTIPISSSQIAAFRKIRDHHGSLLQHNTRPIQPLNGRVVLYNTEAIDFEPKKDDKYNINDIQYEVVPNPNDQKRPKSGSISPALHDINKLLTALCLVFASFFLAI